MSGRPTKFKEEYIEQVERLSRLGLIDRQMCDFFGVNEKTFNNWKHSHPEFLQSLKKGKIESDVAISESLFKKAQGYDVEEYEDVMYKGEKQRLKKLKHVPADTVAAIFWLCNRQPEYWKNKREVKLDGDEEKPFVMVLNKGKKEPKK